MKSETGADDFCFKVKMTDSSVLELKIPKNEEDPSPRIEEFCTRNNISFEQKKMVYQNIYEAFLRQEDYLTSDSVDSFQQTENDLRLKYSDIGKRNSVDGPPEHLQMSRDSSKDEPTNRNAQSQADEFTKQLETAYQSRLMQSFQEHETESVIDLQDEAGKADEEESSKQGEPGKRTESGKKERVKKKKRRRQAEGERVEDRLMKKGREYRRKKTIFAEEQVNKEMRDCTFQPNLGKKGRRRAAREGGRPSTGQLDEQQRCLKVKEILDSLAQNDYKIQIRNKVNNESYFWNQQTHLNNSESISKMFFSNDSRKEERNEEQLSRADLHSEINKKLDKFMTKQNPHSESVGQIVQMNGMDMASEKSEPSRGSGDRRVIHSKRPSGALESGRKSKSEIQYTFGMVRRGESERLETPFEGGHVPDENRKNRIYTFEEGKKKKKRYKKKHTEQRINSRKKHSEKEFKSHIKYKQLKTYSFQPKINRLPKDYTEQQRQISLKFKMKEKVKTVESNLKGEAGAGNQQKFSTI